jgi:hypothetical protein
MGRQTNRWPQFGFELLEVRRLVNANASSIVLYSCIYGRDLTDGEGLRSHHS